MRPHGLVPNKAQTQPFRICVPRISEEVTEEGKFLIKKSSNSFSPAVKYN
jgi:hypothetical protein